MTVLNVNTGADTTGAALFGTLDGLAPLAARFLIAPLFLLAGINKLGSAEATIAWIDAAGLPFATLGYIAAVVVEIFGSLALIAGYKTRYAAGIMALFTVAAALAFHNQLGDQNQFIHFFKNIAIAGGLLQIVAFGAGRYSLDAKTK
ncbi:DoxX family protein [Roseibium sediminicola]|uniref:DoxX family protein n=1 Tax=Roseibium sediminicola TaxID=2933272 RepID=A0ABT0GNP8_9HYPH|nr:DoxX family protein [Roseibium sp. CAU 1639]MCK7611049.1 DoxX family protein [Roseibium sp. CAU 1639]